MLNRSKLTTMKERRFGDDDSVWWAALAFDQKRETGLVTKADKSGGIEMEFYKRLIKTADERIDHHLVS